MGQWLSWLKSNEKEILTILDDLSKKAVDVSEELVRLFEDINNAKEHQTKIKKFEREADELTRSVFAELNKTFMTSKLGNIKGQKDLINHCRNTSDIEHNIDDLYRTAVGKLFESNDPITIIKLKDIYESIETASDRTVDVADVIEDIVLKYA